MAYSYYIADRSHCQWLKAINLQRNSNQLYFIWVIAMKDYREMIRNKRIKLGISQNKLAKLVGITQPYMYEIECGRKSPSIEVLQKICQELSIEMFCDKE